MNAPPRPQLPAQPITNPNNKVVHQFETHNMSAYSISQFPYNDIHLRSGRVVEPIVIEDVPSSMNEARMNKQFENSINTKIPIIEGIETPTRTPVETHAETRIET